MWFAIIGVFSLLTYASIFYFEQALRVFEVDADLHDHIARSEHPQDPSRCVFKLAETVPRQERDTEGDLDEESRSRDAKIDQ